MIVFGTGVRKKKIGEGDFLCPKCQTRRHYEHKKATRYFSLYFIPLIPMNTIGEFVECQTCMTAYETSVLTLKPPQPPRASLAQQLNSIEARLKQGTPIEYILRDLTGAGLDLDVAMKSLQPHLSAIRKICEPCGLTYNEPAATCVSCGNPLKVK